MKRIKTEVLVVGGGPAGAIAARVTACSGIETLLIERDLSFIKPCGGGIPSVAFRELRLPTHSVARQIETMKIVSPSGETVPIRFEGASIAIVRRGGFDAALRKQAAQCGARVIEATFRNFITLGKTIVSEIVNGSEPCRVESDYVIAADGVHSRTRAALGIRPVASILTVTGKEEGEETDCCEFWFGSDHAPRFYSWAFPCEEGLSLGTGAWSPRSATELLRRFMTRRGRQTGKNLEYPMPLKGYRVPLWQGDLYAQGRILFAGDAAGQVMPLIYEGIYYAMKSGEFAAAAVIERDTRAYRRLWQESFGRRFSLMRRLWEYFLENDRRAEMLVRFFKRPEVQDAAVRLLLKKETGKGSLLSYLNLFRRFIR